MIASLLLLGAGAGLALSQLRDAAQTRVESARLNRDLESVQARLAETQAAAAAQRIELRALQAQVEEARPAPPAAPAPAAARAIALLPNGGAPWLAESNYVDLPKKFLSRISFAAVSSDGQGISVEAAALLDMSEEEREQGSELIRQAAQELYQLEKSRLEPSEQAASGVKSEYGAKISFRLRADPEATAKVTGRLKEQLEDTLGPERGSLLLSRVTSNQAGRIFEAVEDDTYLTFTARRLPEGAITHGFFTSTKRGSSSNTGGDLRIPPRWQHLITPDMLSALANPEAMAPQE